MAAHQDKIVMSVSSETLPLIKILLHAAKHPHLAVNGVLLGTATDSAVSITDAVPLFHNSTQLAMPTEIALTQVRGMKDLHGESRLIRLRVTRAD